MEKGIDLIRELVSHYPHSLMVVNGEGRILYASPASYNLYPVGRIEGCNISAFMGSEILKKVKEVISTGVSFINLEGWFSNTRGKKKVSVDIFPVETQSDPLAGMVLRDISHYSTLLEMEEREKLTRSLEDLVKRIFSQIQPISTGILNICNYLEETGGFSEEIELIKREALRLNRVVEEALDLAVDSHPGKMRVNIYKIIENALSSLSGYIEDKRIALERKYIPGVPDLRADPLELFKAIYHVIRNAVDSSPREGKVEIEVVVDYERKLHPGERAVLEIRVCDYGNEVPEDLKEKIFHPFVTTKDGHTGLGLSKAYKVFREHGGDIEYRREDEKNIFVMRLPL